MITVKAARVNKNLTQKQAALMLGISADTLSNYERGITFPNIAMLRKIEALYEISYEELIFSPDDYGETVY